MGGEPRFVGIDVSKAQLDVAVRPTGKRWVLPYDETGIEGLIPQIVDLEPALTAAPRWSIEWYRGVLPMWTPERGSSPPIVFASWGRKIGPP